MGLQWLLPMMHPDSMKDTALVESILQMFERKNPAIQEAQVNALLNRPDAREVAGQVQCPALLLTGEQDAWSPPSVHAEMAAAIPDSMLVVVPACGHMSMMEQPLAVTEAMRAWLQASAAGLPSQGRTAPRATGR